jgi:tRNA pseudouridine38-40 synthase
MVRNMVGLLVEIGSGKKDSNSVKDVLLAEDRTKAGITIDPNGLYLEDVYYE